MASVNFAQNFYFYFFSKKLLPLYVMTPSIFPNDAWQSIWWLSHSEPGVCTNLPAFSLSIVPFPRACKKDSTADLLFLVDEAVGTTENLGLLQNFLKNVTSSMDVQNNCLRLGLMSYSDRVKTFSLLNSSTTLSEFQEQIQKLSLGAGKSNAGAALEQMRREGFSASHGSRRSQGVPQIAVLVTNRPSDDNVREVALDLRLQDVTVLSVGIEGANKTQLEEIVSYPPGQTISMLGSYADLHNYRKNFLKKLQNEIWSQISTQAEQVELDKTGMF